MAFPIISALLSLGIWLVWKRLRTHRLRQPTVNGKASAESDQEFVYPAISPDADFDINTTPAVPYRPFKWGPTYAYVASAAQMLHNKWSCRITMGIRNMDFDNWIEVQLSR
jgi:hypothetical protein